MDLAKIQMAANTLMECGICLQVFLDPRILPCGHTFCLQCIEKSNCLLCSLCKRESSVPTNGLQGLPKNLIPESFFTSLSSVSNCAVTKSNLNGPVEFFCVNCWEPLCTKCGQGHAQYNKITSHSMVKKINEIDQSGIELHNRQGKLLCNQHKDKPIEFHCTICDKFICYSCYILFHNKHDCVSVEDVNANLLVQLNEVEKIIKDNLTINEENMKAVKSSNEALANNESILLGEVKTLKNNIKEKLQIEYKKIVAKIDDSNETVTNTILKK